MNKLNFRDKFGNTFSCYDNGKIFIEYPTKANEYAIGHINDAEDELKKFVKKSKHFLRNIGGWGVPKEIIDRLSDDCYVVCRESEEKKEYKITVELIKLRGVKVRFKQYEEQYVTPIQYWQVEDM